MVVFICYARRDAEVVDLLRRDIERAKRTVWVDRELTGGQEWWETILSQIRGCSLFVFALSPESLRSRACMLELRYALVLGRPLLPVMVSDTSVQLAPPEIGNAQIVDYRQRNADSAFALVNALVQAPPAPALPAVLPPPPVVPLSYANTRREEVDAEVLSYHDQTSLYVELRGQLQDEDGRDAALGLLRRLRQRRDIVESVGRDIDLLLAEADQTDPASPSAAAAGRLIARGTGAARDDKSSDRAVRSGEVSSTGPLVFLSYASEDRVRVVPIIEQLKGDAVRVFWDRRIPPAANPMEFLGRKLVESCCVVVVWTVSSVRSRYVRSEARHGFDNDRLVPILLDDPLPPFPFAEIQAADLSAWDGSATAEAFAELVTAIRAFALTG